MIESIKRIPQDILEGWNHFFFAPHASLPVAVFRFAFGLNAFVMYMVRFGHWREYFTDAAFLPATGAFEILQQFYRPDISWYPATTSAAFAMNLGLVLSLFFLMIGLFPRLAALIAFFLHIGLIQRNYAVAYGADFISTFFLFSLIFLESDLRFSLSSILRKRFGRVRFSVEDSLSQLASSAAFRVLQIQLCLIYAYTGLEKMKGPSWWDGTAVWTVLGNRQILFVETSWLQNVPLLIALMTFGTVFFEIYFTPLVWAQKTRKWILLLGVGMHVGIALTIGLFYFSFGMISVYFVFLSADSLERFFKRFKISSAWLG